MKNIYFFSLFFIFYLTTFGQIVHDTSLARFNPLSVGNKWIYLIPSTSPYVERFIRQYLIAKDTLINNKRYFNRLGLFNGSSWERNDTITGRVMILDNKDLDQDGDSLEELLITDFSATDYKYPEYFTYKSYKFWYGQEPDEYAETLTETFEGYVSGRLVAIKNIVYERWLYEEDVAEYFGVVGWQWESPWRSLVYANIDGVEYGERPVSVLSITEMPTDYFLTSYPNPFNPETRISFKLKNSGKYILVITDLLGREVLRKTGEGTAGEFTFNASNLPSGTYFAILQNNGRQLVHKMMLIK